MLQIAGEVLSASGAWDRAAPTGSRKRWTRLPYLQVFARAIGSSSLRHLTTSPRGRIAYGLRADLIKWGGRTVSGMRICQAKGGDIYPDPVHVGTSTSTVPS